MLWPLWMMHTRFSSTSRNRSGSPQPAARTARHDRAAAVRTFSLLVDEEDQPGLRARERVAEPLEERSHLGIDAAEPLDRGGGVRLEVVAGLERQRWCDGEVGKDRHAAADAIARDVVQEPGAGAE